MQVKATLKNLRISPKKVRLVVDLVRGMDSIEAQSQLSFLNKGAAKAVLKLLNSAIANGENNLDLKKSNLFIKDIRVDSGMTIKRWRPRAFGRAAMIKKRTSHISLVLEEKIPTVPKKSKKAVVTPIVDKSVKREDVSGSKTAAVDKDKGQMNVQDSKMHGDSKGFAKKVFQRKAG
jgi:large subunit ribosomal protein L22